MRSASLQAAVVVCLVSPAWSGLLAQTPSPPITPKVSTVGTASRSVRPNLAIFSIDMSAEGPTPLEAARRVAAIADTLRRVFQAMGIPRDSLVTGSQWYWWRGRTELVLGPMRYVAAPGTSVLNVPQQDTAYRAFEAIRLRIRDLSKVGAAIDSTLAHRVTQISPITFTATATDADHQEALRLATENARMQATAIAEAGRARLGRVLSYSTQDPLRGYSEPYFEEASITTRGSSAEQGTQIVEPLISVRATVYATWELLSQ